MAIILGTGLGGLVKEIKSKRSLPYSDIPHFPVSTVATHESELYAGFLSGKPVYVLAGRFHFYEGYSLEQVTFPVRVLRKLGVKTLLISNAAGGMNRNFNGGDIMLVRDHINFMGVNPLVGPNDDRLGPRFPDLFDAYDPKLVEVAENAARDLKIPVQQGTYIAVSGPNLETPAEYRFFGQFADAVGMSTVPEVIVARHSGMKVLAFSIITDLCHPEALKPANIEEIIHTATKAEKKLTALVKEVVKRIR